jgi:hypothetical protein
MTKVLERVVTEGQAGPPEEAQVLMFDSKPRLLAKTFFLIHPSSIHL